MIDDDASAVPTPAPGREPADEPEGAGDVAPAHSQESAQFVDEIEARIMGHGRTLRRADVAQRAGVSREDTRRLWRALGFASPRDEDVMFNDADVDVLRTVREFAVEHGFDQATVLSMARALGRSTDRLAMWQSQIIADFVRGDQGIGLDRSTALVVAERIAELADELEPLLVYTWRRNLAVAVSRMVADAEPETHIGVVRTVGFADLVSFTQLVRQLSERELARLVLRFEALASDIVSAHGGALVKTVGDEVLFTHQEIGGAVDIAFDLLAAAAADDLVPRMRVGMATGRVLARLGDIYGNTVNRAARLTAIARPGTALVDPQIARAVQDRPGVRTAKLDPVDLPGLGELEPWALQQRAPIGQGEV